MASVRPIDGVAQQTATRVLGEGPYLYSATFHRHTAEIVLSLPKEAQITVQGYIHPSGDPTGKRMDTCPVINLLSYPGKPEEPQSNSRFRYHLDITSTAYYNRL